MEEERPVEAMDKALLAGSCKWFLLAEGEVTGGAERVLTSGVEWVLTGGVDRVLTDGAEGDAPGDLVGDDIIALDVKEVS